ncbi:hypothetical protein [Pelagovum pacificum]|uniref:hypothetical protein n=1 Tax=Pelagovum pacificum TaxID=2588711 RepID=UPI0018CECC76|nr:hypothetical protein [Pelagovum pacificum]QQA43167.1 hypothetical protein I8N54_00930 [Pelagovum pacificum]
MTDQKKNPLDRPAKPEEHTATDEAKEKPARGPEDLGSGTGKRKHYPDEPKADD